MLNVNINVPPRTAENVHINVSLYILYIWTYSISTNRCSSIVLGKYSEGGSLQPLQYSYSRKLFRFFCQKNRPMCLIRKYVYDMVCLLQPASETDGQECTDGWTFAFTTDVMTRTDLSVTQQGTCSLGSLVWTPSKQYLIILNPLSVESL